MMQDAKVVVVGLRGWDGWKGGVTNVCADDRTLAGDFDISTLRAHPAWTSTHWPSPTPTLLVEI